MFREHKNTILAIVLSLLVVVGWQYFIGYPQMERQRQQEALKQQEQSQTQPGAANKAGTDQPINAQPNGLPGTAPEAPGLPNTAAPSAQSQAATREAVLAATPRVAIETPRLGGSIDLKGGRIDDITLTQYRETIDPNSPPIVMFAPSGAPDAYYAEFGWVAASGTTATMPSQDTLWQQQGSGKLAIDHPVTLTYDNGQGLVFTRTIAVDDHYLFTIKDQVANKGCERGHAVPLRLGFAPRRPESARLLHSA